MSGKFEVVETNDMQLREPLVIFGFVGAGLVGQIAVNHMTNKMIEIAHVRSMHIPPSVVFIDGELKHPFRIYSDNEGKLCTIVCDAPISSESIYPVALGLFDWRINKEERARIVFAQENVDRFQSQIGIFEKAERTTIDIGALAAKSKQWKDLNKQEQLAILERTDIKDGNMWDMGLAPAGPSIAEETRIARAEAQSEILGTILRLSLEKERNP